jgi:hypothetical protein
LTTRKNDLLAILLLLLLWLLFFWRLLTPVRADQASIKLGDFSGQFVTFAAYQYDRLTQGEVPLWNPYNNSGLPFIADTQAAVFYPPRLATIGLSSLAGGWTYHALELEMALHVLANSLLMYALIRRMTLSKAGSITGSLAGAVISSYGGFLTGYPVQQLAILEAAVWLPLALLGILEATRAEKLRWLWLVLSGFALGLSWMAGHPQTTWFLTYLLAAYLAYRMYTSKRHWMLFARGIVLIGLIAGGAAAVQMLPGIEYLAHTARTGLTYDAKGNGFPFRDILQFVFPGQLSLFSPLYIGISGLLLFLILLWIQRAVAGSLFWMLAALVALAWSFGANAALFPALYNLLPGLRFFRGQERAAFLITNSLAILAGLTTAHLLDAKIENETTLRRIHQVCTGLIVLCGTGMALAGTGWLSDDRASLLNTAVFSTLMAVLSCFVLWNLIRKPASRLFPGLLIALMAFDLFTINMDASHNYDPVPPDEQISLIAPPLVATVQNDQDGIFRVDGFRGLTDNYASLYRVLDMRGISPLFLDGPFQIIEPEKINPLAWELFAVRYVFSDWQSLPAASEIIATGEDRYGPVNLHRLADPRPFAHLVYDAVVLDSDDFARALLRDPSFDPRHTVILNQPPSVELPSTAPESDRAVVTHFAPEQISIDVSTPENAILTLAHPDYPGWQAAVDGEPAHTMRAYGALTSISVPAGQHRIEIIYDPLSYKIGAMLSLFTWAALGILGLLLVIRRNRNVRI